MELRPYQKDCLLALWEWFRTNPQGAPLLVLPTGAGKSIIIAEIARKVAEKGLDRRVLVLQHRSELIRQNYEKLVKLWPFGSVGVYSAGLGKRDTSSQVVFAGVQSVYKRAADLGKFSLVIIDEAHLVPPGDQGMYRTLINGLKEQNPLVRFVGLSATPYRMGSGLLTQGKDALFTDVAYDVNIKDLIDADYLSPLISKSCKSKPDLSGVQVRAGEFVADQMEKAFNRLDLVEAALAEVVTFGADRKSWLIFAAGVSHAKRISEVLTRVGIRNGVVTGDTPPLIRAQILADFKDGRLRALVNVDVLTTGYDHPAIDLVVILRATKSTALFVQMCGRACRKAEGKENALILDMGRNILEHGPLDKIKIGYRRCPLTGKKEGEAKAPPMKECLSCCSVVPLQSRECPDCGFSFPEPTRLNHGVEASDAPILSEPPKPIEVTIFSTDYAFHNPKGKPVPTLRVDHAIGVLDGVAINKVSEWVCLEHEGFALRRAERWWRERSIHPLQDYPDSVQEGLDRARAGELRRPKRALIVQDDKWWRLVKVLEYYPDDTEPEDEGEKFFKETGVNL